MIDDIEQKLEIYKLYVNSSLKITEQRNNMNKYFITMNIAILGAQSFFNILAVLSLLIFLNILWFVQIGTYKSLNAAKFTIINKMEKDFSCSPFEDEYKILLEQKSFCCTSNERVVPVLFIIFYIVFILYAQMDKLISYICR